MDFLKYAFNSAIVSTAMLIGIVIFLLATIAGYAWPAASTLLAGLLAVSFALVGIFGNAFGLRAVMSGTALIGAFALVTATVGSVNVDELLKVLALVVMFCALPLGAAVMYRRHLDLTDSHERRFLLLDVAAAAVIALLIAALVDAATAAFYAGTVATLGVLYGLSKLLARWLAVNPAKRLDTATDDAARLVDIPPGRWFLIACAVLAVAIPAGLLNGAELHDACIPKQTTTLCAHYL